MKKNTETRPSPARVELAKTIIEFSNTERPTISDYCSLYAPTYGQYPNVRCIITVDTFCSFQSMQNPIFTYKDGQIDVIHFNINEKLSGCLVLS